MGTSFGITVGELKKHLEVFEDDCLIYAGGLTFEQLKKKSEKSLRIDFKQSVYETHTGEIIIDQFDLGEQP